MLQKAAFHWVRTCKRKPNANLEGSHSPKSKKPITQGREYEHHEPLSLPLHSISHIEQIVQPAKHTFSKFQFLIVPLDVQESWACYCPLPRGHVYANWMGHQKLGLFPENGFPRTQDTSSSDGYISLGASATHRKHRWSLRMLSERKCEGSGIVNTWVLLLPGGSEPSTYTYTY